MSQNLLKVKHISDIFLVDYPDHFNIKNELFSTLENYVDAQGYNTNVKATMTEWDISSPEIENLKSYVLNFLSLTYPFISETNQKFVFADFWANIYRKNEYTIKHDHLFCSFSIVYFLKATKDAAPLIFSESKTKIDSIEGRLVIFPSYLLHEVPSHTSEENRITLSGNIELINYDK